MILTLAIVLLLAGVGTVAGWWAGGGLASRPHRLDPTSPARAAVIAFLTFQVTGSIILLVTGESDGAGPLLAAGSLAAFGIGALLARRVLGPTGGLAPAAETGLSLPGVAVLAAVGLVAVGVLIFEYQLPLLAADPLASRSGYAGPLFDLFRWFVPAASVALVALAGARGSAADIRVAVVAVAAVLGLEILLASRALPAELAIEVLLVTWWAGRRIPAATWLAIAGVGLVLFVGVQLVRVAPREQFTGAADAAGYAGRRTVDRVLLIHPRTLEVVATSIPANEPYFGGSTYVRRIGILLGQEDRPSLGYWLYERLFPDETGGFAAPGVAGEAWANGGPVLVVAIMGLLGVAAVWLGGVVARLPGGPADRTLAALVVVAVARTYATSLNGFLFTLLAAAAWWLVASGRLTAFATRGRMRASSPT